MEKDRKRGAAESGETFRRIIKEGGKKYERIACKKNVR